MFHSYTLPLKDFILPTPSCSVSQRQITSPIVAKKRLHMIFSTKFIFFIKSCRKYINQRKLGIFGALYTVACKYVYRCIDTSRKKLSPYLFMSDVNDPFGGNVGCAIFPALSLLSFDRLTDTPKTHKRKQLRDKVKGTKKICSTENIIRSSLSMSASANDSSSAAADKGGEGGGDGDARPKQSSDESLASSAATSDEYEVVTPAEAKTEAAEAAAEAAASSSDPRLSIVVGEGREADLQENMDECLKSGEG